MQQMVVLERNCSAPRLARAALSEFDQDLEGRNGDARLVVSELVTNRIQQNDGAANQPIEFSIQLDDASLWVEVCDPGEHHRDAANSPEKPTTFVGLGLAIVNRLADAWGVNRDGRTCLWARFDHQRLT